jgi:hypothetical protein
MKVGDIVKTKVPGFGTGNKQKIGTIIESYDVGSRLGDIGTAEVLHVDGTVITWHTFQLEVISESR